MTSAEPPRRAPARVTVAIPAYNGARFLGEAIASVLGQTVQDLELIVVDDCSTDATPSVIAAFDDPRLSSVTNQARLGLVGNWNRCLALAAAPYVCVFHQDDVMLPDNLARKLAVLDANPAVGMVHSNVYQIDAAGVVLSAWWYFERQASDEGVHAGRDAFGVLFRGVNRVCAPSVVWRRDLYAQLGGFDARLPFTADWEMWMRLALFADVGYLGAPLVRYRRHDGNETGNFLGAKEIEHAFLAKRVILEKYPERVPDLPARRHELLVRSREWALAEAAHHYARRQPDEAQPYAALALALRLDDGTEDDPAWVVDAIDRMRAASAAPAGSFRRVFGAILARLGAQPGLRWLRGAFQSRSGSAARAGARTTRQ